MSRRIIAGASVLDKLPAWLAVPLGMIIGVMVGYWVAVPGVRAADFLLAGGALVLASWWGLSAPRAISAQADMPRDEQ